MPIEHDMDYYFVVLSIALAVVIAIVIIVAALSVFRGR